MEIVPEPVMEAHETGGDFDCLAVCFELGNKTITLWMRCNATHPQAISFLGFDFL
jgi:hypothetical protein